MTAIPLPTPDDLARDLEQEYESIGDFGPWPAVIRRCAAAEEKAERRRLEIERLQAVIRRHRDYRGDDRCHMDDAELYAVLPEGDTRPTRETEVTIENCQRFIACRQQGREYVSPQRRIEELEAENERLRRELDDLPPPIATPKDYNDTRWCDHCERDTEHECHDSGHERDSSGDWARCLTCYWRYSGMTGRYTPP